MTTPSPCDKVRTTCEAYISQHSEHVTIDRQVIPALARQIQQQARIEWDEEEWHYDAAPAGEQRQERVALYILALDAINFCFWPSEQPYEYKDLATSMRNAAKRDHDEQQQRPSTLCPSFAFSARNLATMTVEEMRKLFSDHHEHGWVPPDLSVRCSLWNEVGKALLEHFGGSAWTLIQQAQGSAVTLVQMLLDHFAGFRDYYSATSAAGDESLFFLKRAQICVGDWNAALHLNLKDMDQLTTFADYRVPQLLRHCGVLCYSKELSQTVDNKLELEVNSAQELSIRAATVTAVEWIVAHLKQLDSDTKWTAVETDWYLWQVGERMQLKGELAPHHRVRTIYY